MKRRHFYKYDEYYGSRSMVPLLIMSSDPWLQFSYLSLSMCFDSGILLITGTFHQFSLILLISINILLILISLLLWL